MMIKLTVFGVLALIVSTSGKKKRTNYYRMLLFTLARITQMKKYICFARIAHQIHLAPSNHKITMKITTQVNKKILIEY